MSKKLVCFVEGASDQKFLKILIKNIKGKSNKKTKIDCLSLGSYGKLKSKIKKRIQNMQSSDNNFLIMIDQDKSDCRERKNEISQEVKIDKNKRATKVKIRVACRQLESFYLGDLNAVKEGLNIRSKKLLQRKTKKPFSNPDDITNPLEELKKLTGSKSKNILSKAITPYLKIDGTNKSHSFNVLVTAIEHLL
ncbi:hypothetical protein COTS27_00582 [Spirochaetota bacterium]|nr:hypothetical protein COTS27_00582 [Spirochaetota bacterium]